MPFTLSSRALLLACLLCLPAVSGSVLAQTGSPAPRRADPSLVIAARLGQVDIAERLLAGGADPDTTSALGYTALMWAAQNDHYATVQRLLKYGARKDLRNDAGSTALDLAIRELRADVIALLQDAS